MALVSEKIYSFLLAWLCPAMEAEYKALYAKTKDGGKLRGAGKYDRTLQQYRVDRLRTIVRRLVCDDKVKRFLCDGSKSTLYAYNGVCFVRIEDREIFLKELLKRAFTELDLGEKYNDEYPAKLIAQSCLDTLSSSDKYLYVPNRRYVAFNDAVYDIEQRKAVKAEPGKCPAIVLNLDYKGKDELYRECAEKYGIGGNPCKLWEEKIKEILPNNDARSVFQQWCGTLLADKERFKTEYILFIIGPGGNGKSLIVEVIENAFGKDYFTRFRYRQLFKDSDRGANLAKLVGKVANFIDDIEEKELSGGDFKSAASGAEFEARVPYEKRSIKVRFPPIICTANAMPESDDDTYGSYRKKLVVHTTTKRFEGEERDTQLTYKLTRPEALMYIFHWIVEGYAKFVRNKGDIVIGEDMKRSQELIMAQSNSMRRWWLESGYEAVEEYDIDYWRSLAELYDEYKTFATAEGGKVYTRPELSAMLRSKGCFMKHRSIGDGYCLRKSTTE